MSKLVLIPSPIGNLSDITKRAIEEIENSDLIFCEDTRHTVKLLNHLEIKKTLKSYHKFNEHKIVESIIYPIAMIIGYILIMISISRNSRLLKPREFLQLQEEFLICPLKVLCVCGHFEVAMALGPSHRAIRINQ